MKYIRKISAALLLCLTLAACQAKAGLPAASAPPADAPAPASSDAAPAEPSSVGTVGSSSGGVPADAPASASSDAAPAESSSGEPAEAKDARLAEYQFALQQIAFEHVYPDGRDTGFDGAYGFIEDNRFALCDVTGDGVDELIVRFTTAPMAGNAETIYTFQKDGGALQELLIASPNLTYYANGIIKEDWSHGSWLAGEGYWPYTLYRYDAAAGSFEELAQVNMWSKAVDTVNYKGDPYPDDIDAEGAGTVFILGGPDGVKTVSKSDYEQWLADTVGSPAERDIPYQALSEENIKAVRQRLPSL